MRPFVDLQSTALVADVSAHVAAIRPVCRMDTAMIYQRGCSHKLLVAYVAFVRFLTHMIFHVHVNVILGCEFFATDAKNRLLASFVLSMTAFRIH